MSQSAVKEIVERAIRDEGFRKLLFSNPEKAFQGYDLSDAERELLSGLNEENFDDFAGKLGGRTTKGWITGGG